MRVRMFYYMVLWWCSGLVLSQDSSRGVILDQPIDDHGAWSSLFSTSLDNTELDREQGQNRGTVLGREKRRDVPHRDINRGGDEREIERESDDERERRRRMEINLENERKDRQGSDLQRDFVTSRKRGPSISSIEMERQRERDREQEIRREVDKADQKKREVFSRPKTSALVDSIESRRAQDRRTHSEQYIDRERDREISRQREKDRALRSGDDREDHRDDDRRNPSWSSPRHPDYEGKHRYHRFSHTKEPILIIEEVTPRYFKPSDRPRDRLPNRSTEERPGSIGGRPVWLGTSSRPDSHRHTPPRDRPLQDSRRPDKHLVWSRPGIKDMDRRPDRPGYPSKYDEVHLNVLGPHGNRYPNGGQVDDPHGPQAFPVAGVLPHPPPPPQGIPPLLVDNALAAAAQADAATAQLALKHQIGQALLAEQALKTHHAIQAGKIKQAAVAAQLVGQVTAQQVAAQQIAAQQVAAGTAAARLKAAQLGQIAAGTVAAGQQSLKTAIKAKLKHALKHRLKTRLQQEVAGSVPVVGVHVTQYKRPVTYVDDYQPAQPYYDADHVKHRLRQAQEELFRRLILLKPYFQQGIHGITKSYAIPNVLPDLPKGVQLTPHQVASLPKIPIKEVVKPPLDVEYVEYILTLPEDTFVIITSMSKREFLVTLFPRLYRDNVRHLTPHTTTGILGQTPTYPQSTTPSSSYSESYTHHQQTYKPPPVIVTTPIFVTTSSDTHPIITTTFRPDTLPSPAYGAPKPSSIVKVDDDHDCDDHVDDQPHHQQHKHPLHRDHHHHHHSGHEGQQHVFKNDHGDRPNYQQHDLSHDSHEGHHHVFKNDHGDRPSYQQHDLSHDTHEGQHHVFKNDHGDRPSYQQHDLSHDSHEGHHHVFKNDHGDRPNYQQHDLSHDSHEGQQHVFKNDHGDRPSYQQHDLSHDSHDGQHHVFKNDHGDRPSFQQHDLSHDSHEGQHHVFKNDHGDRPSYQQHDLSHDSHEGQHHVFKNDHGDRPSYQQHDLSHDSHDGQHHVFKNDHGDRPSFQQHDLSHDSHEGHHHVFKNDHGDRPNYQQHDLSHQGQHHVYTDDQSIEHHHIHSQQNHHIAHPKSHVTPKQPVVVLGKPVVPRVTTPHTPFIATSSYSSILSSDYDENSHFGEFHITGGGRVISSDEADIRSDSKAPGHVFNFQPTLEHGSTHLSTPRPRPLTKPYHVSTSAPLSHVTLQSPHASHENVHVVTQKATPEQLHITTARDSSEVSSTSSTVVVGVGLRPHGGQHHYYTPISTTPTPPFSPIAHLIPTTTHSPHISSFSSPSVSFVPPLLSTTISPPVFTTSYSPPVSVITHSPSIPTTHYSPPIQTTTYSPPIQTSTHVPPILTTTQSPRIPTTTHRPTLTTAYFPPVVATTYSPPKFPTTPRPTFPTTLRPFPTTRRPFPTTRRPFSTTSYSQERATTPIFTVTEIPATANSSTVFRLTTTNPSIDEFLPNGPAENFLPSSSYESLREPRPYNIFNEEISNSDEAVLEGIFGGLSDSVLEKLTGTGPVGGADLDRVPGTDSNDDDHVLSPFTKRKGNATDDGNQVRL
ncbi:Proline-rich protein 1-like 2 [Homarus americanus]|uniref:Proline-rich protein 1-like 2 n=1 Tax=Homarus americanus TaxID=6706 RepID=A0A8J5TL95_HOMAM|nr:Proline-rich protein 1-like 2 [Homarus americanus]